MQLPETQRERTDIKAVTTQCHADQTDLIKFINQVALPVIVQCPTEITKRMAHVGFKMNHLDKKPQTAHSKMTKQTHYMLHFQLCD